jgi:aldose 1-epimerase
MVSLHDDPAQLEATFAPDAGMLCCSLRHLGEELLAQNAGVEAYAERGKTMGIPLLYPWANRLAAFEYTAAGRAVGVTRDAGLVAVEDHGLPIHGVIGGRLRWELTPPPAADGGPLFARLTWDGSDPAVFAAFPFRHEVLYEARLAEDRLTISVSVIANARDEVPVAFGFHPYVSLPGSPRELWLVELPAMRHLRLDTRQIPVGHERVQGARRFELAGEEFDDGYDGLGPGARFAVAAGGRRVSVEFAEGYPCAQVYAPGEGPFICFEPMTAPANALCSGGGLRVLAPGDSYRATFAVRVEQI